MEIAAPQPEQAPGVPTSVRFAHGAFWSAVGTVGARLATFLGAVVTARFLGQVGYGELAMIQSTIGLLGTFAGLGIGMTATKYVAELKRKDPQRTGRIIALTYLVSWTAGGLMALACIAAAPWLAARTINAPQLVPELRLASLLLFVSAGFGPQGEILAGCQAFRAIARINWWQGLLSLPLTILLVWLAGLRGVILALILSTLIGGGLSSLALRKEYRAFGIRLKFFEAWREKSIFWHFSIPAFLASAVYTPIIWFANALLVRQPGGYAQLGIFNAAMQFQFIIFAINTILAQVSVPMLAEFYGQDDKSRFNQTFNRYLRASWGFSISFGFLALALSPLLISLFGAFFRGGGGLLSLVICYTVITVPTSIIGQSFYSSGKMWYSLANNFIWASSFLIMVSLLVPHYKAFGLAGAFIISHSLNLLVQLIMIKKIFGNKIIENTYPYIIYTLILIIMGIVSNYYNNMLFQACLLVISGYLLCWVINSNRDIFSDILSQVRITILSRIGWAAK
ncbi:MAG: oligosaccharide flippase family protein [Desulfobaccales bacterium]